MKFTNLYCSYEHNNAVLRDLPQGKTYNTSILHSYMEAMQYKKMFHGYDFRIHKIHRFFLTYSFRYTSPEGNQLFYATPFAFITLPYTYTRS